MLKKLNSSVSLCVASHNLRFLKPLKILKSSKVVICLRYILVTLFEAPVRVLRGVMIWTDINADASL